MTADATNRLPLRRATAVVAFLALLLLAALLEAGCDRPAGAADGRTVRVELWTLSLRPRFDDYMNRLVAEFERQNPRVDVVWVDVPFDALQRKFLAAAAAGRAPDVVNLSDGFYARFAAMGGLADLSAHVPSDPAQKYFPGAMSICRMGGKLYALPWYLASNVMMANEALLAGGGLSAGQLAGDWAGLRAQARAYHARTGRFLFCPQLGSESQIPLWIIEEGLSPLRRKRDGAPGLESNLDDPAIVALTREWVDLYRSGALPAESAVGGHGAMIDLYQNGRTALLITGPNFLERIRDGAPNVFRATQVRPSPRASGGQFEIATMLLAVSSQSRHPKEAAELAWFMTSPENQLEFAKIVSILPSTPASLSDPHFAAPPPGTEQAPAGKVALARHVSAESLREGMSFVPALPAWPELTAAFNERIKSALLDGAEVERVLADIGREWNGILDSHEPLGLEVMPVLPAGGTREGP